MIHSILTNRENFFIAIAWILGAIVTVMAVSLGVGSVVEEIPKTSPVWDAVYGEKERFYKYSFFYVITSGVLCVISLVAARDGSVRQLSLAVGGISSLLYLAIAIPLSGGISYSPLSVTLIYLPTVVAWYLAIHHTPHPSGSLRWMFLNSACVYCLLCWLVYSYLILFSPPGALATLLAQQSSGENGSYKFFKLVKGLVVGLELGVAYLFTVIDRAGEVIRQQKLD
jgi:hypothetical protein